MLDMSLTVEQVKSRLLSPGFVVASFPVCCLIRRFSPDWGTTCAWKSCGMPPLRRSIKRLISMKPSSTRWPGRCSTFRAFPTRRAAGWMKTTITGRYFALTFFTGPGRSASAAGDNRKIDALFASVLWVSGVSEVILLSRATGFGVNSLPPDGSQ